MFLVSSVGSLRRSRQDASICQARGCGYSPPKYRSVSVPAGPWLSQCWRQIIRRLDGETLGTEGLRIFHSVDGSEIAARSAPVLHAFLEGNHVVMAIAPDDVDEVTIESYGCFQFSARKKEATITRY